VKRISGLVLLPVLLSFSCAEKTETSVDPNVTTRGSIEVTARLEEIRGDLIDDPMPITPRDDIKSCRSIGDGGQEDLRGLPSAEPPRVADARVQRSATSHGSQR
jgi:hypothetical protein